MSRLVIYGAQGIALGVYHAIKTIFPGREVLCFLVTEIGNNSSTLGGLPVRELNEFISEMSQTEKDDIEIYIGTPENAMEVIESDLEAAGLYNYVRITSLRWADMMQNAYTRTDDFRPLAVYPVGCHRPVLHVYKMVHYKDKAIQTALAGSDYMLTLQVGTELTDERIAPLVDNLGDNISAKNGNYSELTGLYWMWKNQLLQDIDRENSYYGLAHYRRMLQLTDDDVLRLQDNHIDVVLPYPMPYEPDIEAHHLRYLSDSEWCAVLRALDELQPEYAESFKEIRKQGYFYNYNVILAKGNILNDYCRWLFPLLFRIEELNDADGIKKPNRYIGYVGETLETLYFMHNKHNLRIAHSGCRFLI